MQNLFRFTRGKINSELQRDTNRDIPSAPVPPETFHCRGIKFLTEERTPGINFEVCEHGGGIGDGREILERKSGRYNLMAHL